jgi:hypothetical protein
MSKFTKGPWNYRVRVDRFADGTLSEEKYAVTANMGEDTICEMWVDREEEANAHLISACPEMYEACKRAFNWLHVIISDFEIKNPENKDALMGLQNFIYKALSKAEGKE